jgi:hypothetical protein
MTQFSCQISKWTQIVWLIKYYTKSIDNNICWELSNNLNEVRWKLEESKYEFETLIDLKSISSTLNTESSSKYECKQALTKLNKILSTDGITYYEVEESNIIHSLHNFLISMKEDWYGRGLENIEDRINLFKNEIINDTSCLINLINVFQNHINNTDSIKDMHTNNKEESCFFTKNRYTDQDQVRIKLVYQSPPNMETTLSFAPIADEMPKFGDFMEKSEDEDENMLPISQNFTDSAKERNDFYK